MAGFTSAQARDRLAQSVRNVESRTSAEVVVAVRRHSGDYSAADLRCGIVVAFAALAALVLLPHAFDDVAFLADTALFFLAAVAVSRRSVTLRRVFTSARARSDQVRTAALEAFAVQGVGRLPGRNGLLVYASQLERAVVVVPDAGIETDRLGDAWTGAVARLEAALSPMFDLEAFEAALCDLGPLLARLLPRADDDVNELPDEAAFE
jgi:putative membrane protein